MAEYNDPGFTGPFVEMTDNEGRTLRVGRAADTGHVALVADGRFRFTLSDDVKNKLAQWLEVL